MAIYGISAWHNRDLSEELLKGGAACTAYTRSEDPYAYAIFRLFQPEDIVFIKTYTPQSGLKITAIGVVASSTLHQSDLGECVHVQWVWQGEKLIETLDDNDFLRDANVYEEQNLAVQREILDLLPASYRLPDV